MVSTLCDRAVVKAVLQGHPHLGEVEFLEDPHRLKISFSGTLEDSAAVLRLLVDAGVPITEFQLTQDDLETIFLRLGHQQSS